MNKLATVLSKIAYGISIVFIGFLFLNTIHYTFLYDTVLDQSFVHETPDSRLRNLLVIVLVFFITLVISKLFFIKTLNKEQKQKRVFIFSLIVSVLVLIPLFIWAKLSHIAPYWDQAIVYQSALGVINKDYSSLQGLYYQMYPQQMGLIFFESIILRISSDFAIFQYLNAIFVSLIVFLSGRLTKEIWDSPEAELFVVLLNAGFAPFFYYVSFIYGDIFAICACMCIGWLLIKWIKNNKFLYSVSIVIIASITLPIRENTIIFLLASCIVLVISALKDKKITPIIMALILILVPILTGKAITLHYEKKADVKFDNGIPSINWIVMGMQGDLEEGNGVGYYNGYNYSSWNMNNQNRKDASDYSKVLLKETIDNFKANPGYAFSFFRYKVLEQWTEPTFDSVNMTIPDDGVTNEKVLNMYSTEKLNSLNIYMNYFLTIAYAFALMGAVFMLIRDKDFYGLLIAVFYIGIFLFSIIWEAKGRYVLPGFVFLMIFSGLGLGKMSELLFKGIDSKCKK